jgi:hypothetical protein
MDEPRDEKTRGRVGRESATPNTTCRVAVSDTIGRHTWPVKSAVDKLIIAVAEKERHLLATEPENATPVKL